VIKFYPHIKPYSRPIVDLSDQLNPYWVSGFVAGDGGFSVIVKETEENKFKDVHYGLYITQSIRDIELIKKFVEFFKCGRVYKINITSNKSVFAIQDLQSILYKVIPHFDKYNLENSKQLDFLCYKKAIFIIKSKNHFTKEGIQKIKSLSSKINSNRRKISNESFKNSKL